MHSPLWTPHHFLAHALNVQASLEKRGAGRGECEQVGEVHESGQVQVSELPRWASLLAWYHALAWRCVLSGRMRWVVVMHLADRLRWLGLLSFARNRANTPIKVGDRDARGSKRWSFLIKKKESKKEENIGDGWWTIIATFSGGCFGSTPQYSCNCPDKIKQAVPTATYQDDQPDYLGRKFKPRIFAAESLSRYQSQFQRYNRGFEILEKIDFVGIQNGNQYVYRIYTNRSEKYDRNWSSSGAGIGANEDCKHQWAVKFYRGDDYTIPGDVPDRPDF